MKTKLHLLFEMHPITRQWNSSITKSGGNKNFTVDTLVRLGEALHIPLIQTPIGSAVEISQK